MKILKGVEMILIDGVRYELTTPESEAVLESAIMTHHKHIFGPDSFYFNVKSRIKSKAGVVSIPDGYVIYFKSPTKARLAIIEVELASHSIYSHVVPQLGKFNSGIEDSAAKRKLVDVLYDFFDDDEVLKARLKQKIKSGEVHKFISDLVSERPLIVVAIDERTAELDEALHAIKGDVRVVEFKTFRRESLSDDVNAYVFEPIGTLRIEPDPVSPKYSEFRGPIRREGLFKGTEGGGKTEARKPSMDDRTLELVSESVSKRMQTANILSSNRGE
jgi:hypothetical protein